MISSRCYNKMPQTRGSNRYLLLIVPQRLQVQDQGAGRFWKGSLPGSQLPPHYVLTWYRARDDLPRVSYKGTNCIERAHPPLTFTSSLEVPSPDTATLFCHMNSKGHRHSVWGRQRRLQAHPRQSRGWVYTLHCTRLRFLHCRMREDQPKRQN